MKKYIFLLVVMFVVTTIFIIEKTPEDDTVMTLAEDSEVKAIYLSYIELDEYITDNESEAKKNIDIIIDNLSKDNFNWLILQVRAFSDSIYPSSIYINKYKFDVLEYFIDCAHEKNIKVHAWINPYRISLDSNYEIEKDNPAYQFIGTNSIKVLDNGIYYNPASSDVTSLIIEGIEEIIDNYDVDGIHFDDYFYPSSDIDEENYQEYLKSGGDMSLSDYHLYIIKDMISKVYKKIKEKNEDILFGIAPQGNISNNYDSNYLDVKEILKSSGYIDYIMPQIYFGFFNEVMPYTDTIDEWNSLIENEDIMLMPALSLYKSGSSDEYAKSGSNEWIENSDILKRQIIYSRNISQYQGFSIFRYDFMYNSDKQNSNMIEEVSNILNVIRKI